MQNTPTFQAVVARYSCHLLLLWSQVVESYYPLLFVAIRCNPLLFVAVRCNLVPFVASCCQPYLRPGYALISEISVIYFRIIGVYLRTRYDLEVIALLLLVSTLLIMFFQLRANSLCSNIYVTRLIRMHG